MMIFKPHSQAMNAPVTVVLTLFRRLASGAGRPLLFTTSNVWYIAGEIPELYRWP